MTEKTKAKKKVKIISMAVILAMLIGNVSGVTAVTNNGQNSREDIAYVSSSRDDPLEYMRDIAIEADRENDDPGRLELPEANDGSTDRYIVKYKDNGGRGRFQGKLAAKIAGSEKINEWEVLTLSERMLPSEFAEEIRNRQAFGDIEYIQPDYELSLESIGGGVPESGEAWEFGKITEKTRINGEILVAVVDTGVDIYHDDLAGYIDTANMWDFTKNTNEIYCPANPLESAHGTHICGIISGMVQTLGITNVRILPLKVFDNGIAYTSDIIAAVEYASAKGASIINCSFGSAQENPALGEAIANTDALFVCAAGNNRRDLTKTPSYPACYDLPNVVSVASVNADGGFSYYSNYGENIDITAWGRNITSLLPEQSCGEMTGTSMAAGYVTAVAAIVGSYENIPADGLKQRLLETADRLSNLQDKVNGGRRVSLTNAVNNIVQTNIIQNNPADDFDVFGYQPTESELFELYSSTRVVKIAAGHNHTLVLKSDGTVWAWGDNYYGQLGNGTLTNSSTAVQVIGLTGITDISGGLYHSIALKNDGTVWAWGYNGSGQLGNGSTGVYSIAPVQTIGLNDAIAITANSNHNIIIKDDNTAWAWGSNSDGQLGDGTTTQRTTPVQTIGLSGVTAVSAGVLHSLALKNDGTLWAWGSNSNGQLGDGTTAGRTAPVQTIGLSGITGIAAGMNFSLALKNDGTLWAWGSNNAGQLGDNTTTNKTTPVQTNGINEIKSIAAGFYHGMALKIDGTVWAWGQNVSGQLGDGTVSQKKIPTEVINLKGVTDIAAGENHSAALKNDGTIWIWGANQYGQLGDGADLYSAEFIQINGINNITELSAGNSHILALKSDGSVWAWGNNKDGQLGDGTTINKITPIQVTNLSSVIAIAAGDSHSIALKNDGTVWSWGSNSFGKLGDGTMVNKKTPVQVTGLYGIVAIAAGYNHNIAVKSDGSVWAWGYNGSGQLGDGTTANKSTPVQAAGIGGIIEAAAGMGHSMALKNDGTVWAWGNNGVGQLGDNTTSSKTIPVLIAGITNVKEISAGYNHSIALKNDGTVWDWGYNYYGQLGDNTTLMKKIPIQIMGVNGMTAVDLGDYHSLTLKSDGTLWSWGKNSDGQLGDVTPAQKMIPVQSDINGVIYITAGGSHSIALKNDGTLWACGSNGYGQLGIPCPQNSSAPVLSQTGTTAPVDWPSFTSIIKNDITIGNDFIVICSIDNVTSIDEIVFRLSYEPLQVTLVDFAAQTPELNITAGIVPGTDLEICSHDISGGILTFTVNKTVPPGQMWSGSVTILKFNAKVIGPTAINFENISGNGLIEIAPMPGSGYNISANGIMTGIMPETSVTDILANIKKINGLLPVSALKVYNNNGLQITGSTFVGTGSYITHNGASQELANIIVYGDLDGNGQVDQMDLTILSRHIAEIAPIIKQFFLIAADATGDGKITIADMIRLARYISGIDTTPLGP